MRVEVEGYVLLYLGGSCKGSPKPLHPEVPPKPPNAFPLVHRSDRSPWQKRQQAPKMRVRLMAFWVLNTRMHEAWVRVKVRGAGELSLLFRPAVGWMVGLGLLELEFSFHLVKLDASLWDLWQGSAVITVIHQYSPTKSNTLCAVSVCVCVSAVGAAAADPLCGQSRHWLGPPSFHYFFVKLAYQVPVRTTSLFFSTVNVTAALHALEVPSHANFWPSVGLRH